MGARITELLASSQTAGEQGNVDAAQAAAAQADVVKVSQPTCNMHAALTLADATVYVTHRQTECH